jgi:8-amino-3,8-dideoxy-alpha-D-manno-octulosonate transaminase
MGNLPSEVKNQMQDLNNTDFSKSDAWISRTISSLVKIGLTEPQVRERAEKMVKVVSEVTSSLHIQ